MTRPITDREHLEFFLLDIRSAASKGAESAEKAIRDHADYSGELGDIRDCFEEAEARAKDMLRELKGDERHD